MSFLKEMTVFHAASLTGLDQIFSFFQRFFFRKDDNVIQADHRSYVWQYAEN